MRPHHYIKNILVFAALACSGQMFQPEKLVKCIGAFIAFSLISSVVYIMNDIKDREKDRNHPNKCKRPIASGVISVKCACVIACVVFVIAMLCNAFVANIPATAALIIYFVLNVAYSFGLKNTPLLDISILVSGFFIRILYGAFITGIEISNWFYLTVTTMAFFLALGKRRNEIKQCGAGETREVLKAYPISFLDKSMTMCLTAANVFYALWSTDSSTASHYNNEYLVFTTPIVLLITLRYSMDVEGEASGDPVEVLLHDKVLLFLCTVYCLSMMLILYL